MNAPIHGGWLSWAIEARALTKYYPASSGWRTLLARDPSTSPAVDAVDLQVGAGELFGLLGPNGAGKTTLIKMLATLVLPTSGEARVNGYPLSQTTQIKATTGLVTSDERSFYWRLTGRENLEFFARLNGLTPDQIPTRVDQVLEQAQLMPVAGKRFQTYSTGMRQRLSIARALLNRPRLLFLDEPTKGLDPGAARQLHSLIQDQLVSQQGTTVFLTTHDLEEAEALCNRLAVMNQGRILACGSVSELRGWLHLADRYSITVRSVRPQQINRLQSHSLPGLLITPLSSVAQPAEDLPPALITFEAQDGDGSLQAALDILHDGQTQIESILQERASLEAIFTHVLKIGNEALLPAKSQSAALSTHPSAQPVPDAELPVGPRFSPRIALAFLHRDLRNELSYRFSFLLQLFGIFFTVGVFYYISQLLGPAAAPYLQDYGGDYFPFVLIGIAFSGYFGVGLTSFANSLRQAQTTGTLEAMLSTPTSLSAMILSSSLWDYLLTTARVLVYLLVGFLLAGFTLRGGNFAAALLVLLLTIVAFSSLGVLAASFIMVLKRGDPITWAFSALSSLLGGVYYPISVLPGWLQGVSALLPITYALHAMRAALLNGAPTQALLPDLAVLGGFCLVLLPLSLWAFRFAVRRAMIDGSLTHY